MKKTLVCMALAAGLVAAARAEESSFQLSLVPDCALRDTTDTITFLALNVWGMNPQHSLTIGLINGSYGKSSGVTLGAVNYTADNYSGVQAGLVNFVYSDYSGIQAACLNYVSDECLGVQFGFANYAGRLKGFQFGLLNMAAQADRGLQIGLVNLMPETSTWFAAGQPDVAPVMVLANWRF